MNMSLVGNTHQQESFNADILPWFLGLALAFPWVFIFALPPLQIGIWLNTEGVAFGIASLGAIATFVLLCLVLHDTFYVKNDHHKKFNIYSTFQSNSLLIGISGLAILSVITLPFSHNKILSWFGHPEQMTGGWLWLSIAAILLCFLWLKKHTHYASHRKAIKISVILACYAQIALVLFAHPQFAHQASGNWVLFHFTAHLGWIGACLLLLSIEEKGRLSLIPFIIGIFAILISQNKTAISALILGPLVFFMISTYMNPKYRWKSLIFILISIPVLLILSQYIAYAFDVFPTLSSRFISLKFLWSDMMAAPIKNLLLGNGWGQMSDSILRQLAILTADNIKISDWDGIDRFDASSLNQTADALAATGILGAFFSLFIPLSPFLKAKEYFHVNQFIPENKVNLGLLFTACFIFVMLHHSWFLMLSIFPIFITTIMIMELPISAQSDKSEHTIKEKPLKALCLLGCLITALSGGVLVWTSHSLYTTATFYTGHFTSSLPVRLAWKFKGDFMCTCDNLVANQGPGSITLAFWLRSYLSSTRDPSKRDILIENDIKCALQTIYKGETNPSLTLLSNYKIILSRMGS